MDSRFKIPALQYDRTVGTYVESAGAERKAACKRGSRMVGKSAIQRRRRDADRTQVGKRVSHVPRKAAIVHAVPVPQTDTGG